MSSPLYGEVRPVSTLTNPLIAMMHSLFAEHFADGHAARFTHDLTTKQWVILLRAAESGMLQGFSTLALAETTYQGQSLSIVYSGDTVIRPAYWGTPTLPQTWIQAVLRLTAAMAQPVYWLLISSGYKTYRFLPVFYRQFYPRYDQPTPAAMQALLDHLAHERFGPEYQPETGVVRFQTGATPLRAGIADLTPARLRDPHVAFFLQRNPGHAQGDELLCLTQIHPDNLTAAGRRMLR